MNALSKQLKGLEETLQRVGLAVRWLGWPVLYAIAVGVSFWADRHKDQIKALVANKISFEQRVEIAIWAGGSLAGLLAVYVSVALVERLFRKRWSVISVFGKLNRWLVGLLALPFVTALRAEGVERSDPIWTVLLAAVAALAVGAAVYAWPAASDRADAEVAEADPQRQTWKSRWLPKLLVGLALAVLWAGYGYFFSEMSITNHHGLNTRTTDLGYYDNIFYQSLHGRPLGCSFIKGGTHASAHFDPILVLLAPLYHFYARAELLLALQSIWLGAGVVPVYLLARAKLNSRGAGLALAIAYVLYPALHGANMYEFHSLTLITPVILWLIYCLELRHFKSYAGLLVLACLCREDVPLLLCFVGLYGIVSSKRGLARAGLLTIVWCVAYYVLVKAVFMPAPGLLNTGSKGGYSYEYYFRDLIPHKKGILGMLLTLVSNPLYAIRKAFGNQAKVLYLLQIFVPLALLPLFARRARLMLVYGLLVTLLATRKPVFRIHFQYACLIFPLAFAAAPEGLRQLREDSRVSTGLGLKPDRLVRGAMGFVLMATLLLSWKFGALAENKSFRGGFGRIARSPLSPGTAERYQRIREMVDMIPPGASVTTTNRVGAHVSNRQHVYFYRQKKQTHFVFADEREIRNYSKRWHTARLQSGELKQLKAYRTFKLWRVDPTKAAATKARMKTRANKKRKRSKSSKSTKDRKPRTLPYRPKGPAK